VLNKPCREGVRNETIGCGSTLAQGSRARDTEVIPSTLEKAVASVATEWTARSSETVIEAVAPGEVRVAGRAMINKSCCDYLGFARDPRVVDASRAALDEWGLGSAAGRLLSGTTTLHRELEHRLADWVGCDDAVLHGSCWTANGAIFGALAALAQQAGTSMAVLSDRLNHASIIDAIRAQHRTVSRLGLYGREENLVDLRNQLSNLPKNVVKVIVTDGVFSMEGDQARLDVLCDVAQEFDALLIVDDSHATGVTGATGRGTAEAQGVLGQVDVITGTLGKALGGAIGGFVAGNMQLMAALRATSRPYTFSNNPPAMVVAGALEALRILKSGNEPLTTLRARVHQLRSGVTRLGLNTHSGEHPIVPVIIGNEDSARATSEVFFAAGVFATAQIFPIVPCGEARIRLQVSAAHSEADIDHVLESLSQSVQCGP